MKNLRRLIRRILEEQFLLEMGYGSALINFEKGFFKGKYNYISGSHDGRLENIEFWKKHRDILKTSIKKDLSGNEFVSYETICYL